MMEWQEILDKFKRDTYWHETKSANLITRETVETILEKLAKDEAEAERWRRKEYNDSL